MKCCLHIQVCETVEAHDVPVEVEEDTSEAPVPAAQDNGKSIITDLKYRRQKKTLLDELTEINDCFFHSVNIQQIAEFSSETYDAVTSMVAMAPGTVTVVQQVKHASLLKKWCIYSHDSLTISIYSLHCLFIIKSQNKTVF